MRLNTAQLLFLIAPAACGVVIPKNVTAYLWDITQWQAGLSHGNPASPTTSWYAFTVSGAAYGSPGSPDYIPTFGARCNGAGAGFPLSSDYSDCVTDSGITEVDSSVAARIVPSQDGTQAHIAISYVFSTVSQVRNFTAIAVTDWARERPPYNFALTPITCEDGRG